MVDMSDEGNACTGAPSDLTSEDTHAQAANQNTGTTRSSHIARRIPELSPDDKANGSHRGGILNGRICSLGDATAALHDGDVRFANCVPDEARASS